MRRVVITGYDLMTALGCGREANRRVFLGESGIAARTMSAAGENVTGMLGEAGQLPDISFFDDHGLRPDRCVQMALVIAERCMAEAGFADVQEAERFGVSVGTSLGGMLSGDTYHLQWIQDGFEAADGEYLRQYPLHAVADALALRFGLQGYRNIISTACAASGNSIGYAFDVIRDGSQDMMLAGGVDPLSRFSFSGFTALKAIDPEPCRPYSQSHGINLGEGAAFFVLEEYEHAKKRGATILAEVLSCGLSGDAYHQTAPAKGGVGAIRSMRAALEEAGLEPADISYVNGHGTGTGANDVNETLAFREVFGDTEIPISSTKGATGHCLGAAGAVECAFCLMTLQENRVPPTVRFENGQDNGIDYVPNVSEERTVERVLTNSFAFGGNNCSLLIGKAGTGKEPAYPLGSEDRAEEIVITGIGCVGTGGADPTELFDTFSTRKKCTGRNVNWENAPWAGKYSANMPEVPYKKYIPAPMLRRIDGITRLTMVAGRQAMTDAKWNITRERMNRTGVMYATGTGPLETIESISRSMLTRGIHAVDPSAFPNSVLNAAPGNLSIASQLKGPISTLSVGQVSGLIGIDYAARVLRHHQADAMIAVSADEGCDPLQMGFDKLGYTSKNGLPAGAHGADGLIVVPGSTALMLERRGDAEKRGARIYATIRGFGMASDNSPIAAFSGNSDVLVKAGKLAMEEAGLVKTDLYVSSCCGVPAFDRAEAMAIAALTDTNTMVIAPGALLGTPMGSAGGYGLLAALYSFESGQVADMPDGDYVIAPDLAAYLHKGENRKAEIQTAMITATGFGGSCACLVIEKEPQGE
ncbi:MAG: beta-ketoacyl-[Clostridia bacterium]|nr:beta-ketoacyl-[acyl-carrier-protein] synthase family protein [Clostridia bacterium]